MKNNYKQLTSSPSSGQLSNNFKRSASHALRSSFRMPVKKRASQFQALNLDQLPTHIPPKALKLLQIDLPPLDKFDNVDKLINSTMNVNTESIKIATIRKKSVWANASTSKFFFIVLMHQKNDDSIMN